MTAPVLDCPKQARCPGCPLGARPYEAGLAEKGAQLGAALGAYPGLLPELLPPRAATPALEYRLRAKLVSRGRALGLYERGSHTVLDVTGCRVLSPALTRTSEALRRLLPLPLHGADLRETSEGVLVTLLTERAQARQALHAAAQTLVEQGDAFSVAIAVRRDGDVRLLSGEPEVVVGAAAAKHTLSPGAPYAYAAHGGFVQAHAAQASYVYAELARGLRERLGAGRSPQVLELFAGNGSLALGLAQSGAQVTAVEAYAPAITLAERAAREQGLTLRAVARDATLFAKREAKARFDAVLVNPPRRGLGAELRRALGGLGPRALGYVSCNPHTLARDAQHLQRLGLRLTQVEPLDMIPWSEALEALAWFVPQAPPAPRVLFEDADYLAVEKEAHEILAKAPLDSLTERVQLLPGCQQAEALETWGAGVSGVCWFSKRASADTKPTPLGERTLLVLARGSLRKQGTVTRRHDGTTTRGSRYKKQADVGRHALVSTINEDPSETGTLRDFASIGHPVLGDATIGDAASNQFMEHRHGLDRAFVHCLDSRLATPDGAVRVARSELAPDLSRVLTSLGSD